MLKFIVSHTMQPGSLTLEEAMEFEEAAQHDPDVKGYHSFVNLTEGKAVCIYEARDRDSLIDWFEQNGMPYDSITEVEYEGQHGLLMEV